MRIAVCDDMPCVLEEIRQQMEALGYTTGVDYFSDIKMLYDELNNEEEYDVILMDIDWKSEKTGIDFSEELHKLCSGTQIIYITAYTMDYVEDIFLQKSNLSGFLTKPIKPEQLQKNLEKVKQRNNKPEGKLLIRHKGTVYAILFDEIVCVESQLHKVYITTPNSMYECTEKLDQVKERLDERFLRCHKSYVVNMNHVQELSSSEIILTNGKEVPVSKKRYAQVKEKYFSFLFEKL
jgi:DNA-binding LytR/AlgR family response regulator